MANSVVVIPPPALFSRTTSVDALLSFVEVSKLSCLFFDKVYIDKDIVDMCTHELPASHPGLVEDVEVLQPSSVHPVATKTGVSEVQVFPTRTDALLTFTAAKQFPHVEHWKGQARRVRVKFGRHGEMADDLEMDILTRLGEQEAEHHLAVFQFVGAALEAHTQTINDGSPQSTALESEVLAQLVNVQLPDLLHVPLREILDQRKTKSFESLKAVVARIAERARSRQPLVSVQDSVAQETLRELMEQLAGTHMTKKQYAMKIGTGATGYIPMVSYATTTYDLGVTTKAFLRQREHWLSFFTSLKKTS